LGVVRPEQAGCGLLHQPQRQAEVRVDGFVATPPRPRDLHVAAAATLAAIRRQRPQRHRGTGTAHLDAYPLVTAITTWTAAAIAHRPHPVTGATAAAAATTVQCFAAPQATEAPRIGWTCHPARCIAAMAAHRYPVGIAKQGMAIIAMAQGSRCGP